MSGENYSQARAEDLILGRLVIQRQLASKEAVTSLLKEQKDAKEKQNQVIRLRKLLLDKDILTKEQLQQLENLRAKNFKICPGCYTQFSIEGFADGKKFKCKNCGKVLTVSRSQQKAPAPTPSQPSAPPPPTDQSDSSQPPSEPLSFEQVQEYLCIDSKELGLIIASGELQGFLDGAVMKFKPEDVERVKKSKEVQPTLILDPKTDKPVDEDQSLAPTAPGEDQGDAIDLDEEVDMEKVLSLLQIDEAALRKLMTLGELVPRHEEGKMIFSKEDVMRVKQSRESQPTMILSDVDIESKKKENLVSFEEAMNDLGVDAPTLRSLIANHEIHPIARGERSFFRSSDIAKIRSQVRQGQQESRQHKLSSSAPSGQENFLTFEEVLEILKIEPKELRQLVVSKKLPGIHQEGAFKFKREDVEAFQSQKQKGATPGGQGTFQAIPLLESIPSGPVKSWEGNLGSVKGQLSLPRLTSPVYGLENPDPSYFPASDIIFVQPYQFEPVRNFQDLLLVKKGDSFKLCKVGLVSGQYVLIGNPKSDPTTCPQPNLEVLGKVGGRLSLSDLSAS